MEETYDLAAWTAKPPPPNQRSAVLGNEFNHSSSDSSGQVWSAVASAQDSDEGGTSYDRNAAPPIVNHDQEQDRDTHDIKDVLPRFQRDFYIDIPPLDQSEKEQFEYLPGHFEVGSIISEPRKGQFVVRLSSGEKKSVSSRLIYASLWGNSLQLSGLLQQQAVIPAGLHNRSSFVSQSIHCDQRMCGHSHEPQPAASCIFFLSNTTCA